MPDAPTTSAGRALTDRPGFLLSQLGHYAADRFAERLRPLGLRPRHFGLLTHLANADGRSQQQLADAMGIHRNQMVALIDDLEARGLVERRRHPDDRRAHALFLTATARKLLPRAQRAADQHDADLMSALTAQQRRQLIDLLQRLGQHTGLTAGVHPTMRKAGRPGSDDA
jgi:DNA-binding MarR family transcriptional regulator